MPTGTLGKVWIGQFEDGDWEARARFRDTNGRTRYISRIRPTKPEAIKSLHETTKES